MLMQGVERKMLKSKDGLERYPETIEEVLEVQKNRKGAYVYKESPVLKLLMQDAIYILENL